MEYPVIANLNEYEGYLPKKQSVNLKEVLSLYKEYKQLSKQRKDAKLAEILQQPIMANTYRAAGVAPIQISDYIENVLSYSEEKKNGMITDLYAIYDSLRVDTAPDNQISEQNEWIALNRALVQNLAVPMKRFVAEQVQAKKESTPNIGIGKKVVCWIEKRIFGSKNTCFSG